MATAHFYLAENFNLCEVQLGSRVLIFFSLFSVYLFFLPSILPLCLLLHLRSHNYAMTQMNKNRVSPHLFPDFSSPVPSTFINSLFHLSLHIISSYIMTKHSAIGPLSYFSYSSLSILSFSQQLLPFPLTLAFTERPTIFATAQIENRRMRLMMLI